MRLDSAVWGLTHLFPSTMRGIFDSETVTNSMDKDSKIKITDLYEDLYKQVDNTYNPYSFTDNLEESNVFM